MAICYAVLGNECLLGLPCISPETLGQLPALSEPHFCPQENRGNMQRSMLAGTQALDGWAVVLFVVTVTVPVSADLLSTDVSTDWTFSLWSGLSWVEKIGNC